MSMFRLSIRIFILFQYKKNILYKKKVCLPTCTDPKNFGHVIGNNAYFSFGLRAVHALSLKNRKS